MTDITLVTGGTGSFGSAFVRSTLARGAMVRVLSRDEMKQARLMDILDNPRNLRCALGDVRDPDRLDEAMWGVKTVVHAAALKRIERVAYDAEEVIKTNVLGTINVIRAAIRHGVERVVVLSSDKAVSPSTLYGTSKLAAEFYATQANSIGRPRGTRISCVRYGNVLGSRGSVLHIFREAAKAGRPIPITHPECTRFWITMSEAVIFVERVLQLMGGGEVFIPKLPSLRVVDLAAAVAPGHPAKLVGLRPGGEKIHELLISPDESSRAVEIPSEHCYVLQPVHTTWGGTAPWQTHTHTPLLSGFAYRSDTNTDQLSPAQIQTMIEAVAWETS